MKRHRQKVIEHVFTLRFCVQDMCANSHTQVRAHLSARVGLLLLQQLHVSSQFGDADVFLCNLPRAVFVDPPQTRQLALQVRQPLATFPHLRCRLGDTEELGKKLRFHSSSCSIMQITSSDCFFINVLEKSYSNE